ETDEGLIAGDAELLRRAFENILRNALRHAPQGSTVDVTLHDTATPDAGGRVEVVIADQGKGVPEEALARMFEPFVRANGSSPGGFGLGLAIARRAVLSHGGTITATNRPGGGFSVTVDLPTAAQGVMDDEGPAPK
ncbi:MAG: ATP-binding protein, partial [Zavarzinia sp.]|nr:ATP-binding protein [Zavarzinia sp.]